MKQHNGWMARGLALALALATGACGGETSAASADTAVSGDDVSTAVDVRADDALSDTVADDVPQVDVNPPDASGDDTAGTEEVGGSDGSDSEEPPDVSADDADLVPPDIADVPLPDDTLDALDGVSPEDVADDALDDAQADGGDVGPGDVGDPLVEPPDLVPLPPCNAQTPRRFYDRILQVGPDGLLSAPPASTPMAAFGPTLAGARPPTVRPGTLGEAELFVASAADGACTLTGLDADGDTLFSTTFAAFDCQSPALLDDGLVVVARVGADTALHRFGFDGSTLGTETLTGSSPAAPVVVAGDVYVAHGETLSRFRPGAGVLASTTTGLASITRLAQSDGLVVVSGRSSELTEGLGDRVIRVVIDDDGPPKLTPLTAIELPGAALSETVLLDGCLDPLANGSSHWWCPGGLIASAGAGWLSVHAADTGELITAETLAGMTVSGLATLDDGRLVAAGAMDGGSAVVRALDLRTEGAQSTQLTQLDYGAPYCIGSPVADSDGGVFVTQNNFLHRIATTAGGHGPGWSRPGGDAEGSGRPFVVGQACPGEGGLNFSRDSRSLENETVVGGVVLPDGDLIVAGNAALQSEAAQPYLARYSPTGFQRWGLIHPSGPGSYSGVTAVPTALVTVGILDQAQPITGRVVLSDLDGQVVTSLPLAVADTTVAPVAVAPTGPATVAVLANTTSNVDVSLDVTVFRVSVGSAPSVSSSVPIDWSGTGHAVALTTAGDEVYFCGSTDLPVTGETVTTVARLNGDNSLPWNLTYPVGVANRCEDLELGPNGELLVLDARIAANAATLVRIDRATGAVLHEVPLGSDYRRLVVPADGRPLVASFGFQLARLDGSAVDVLGTYTVPTTFGIVTDLVIMDGRPVVLGAAGPGFATPDLRMVRPAPFGQVGCSTAGRCGGTTCDDLNPCTVDGCLPSTGACAFAPRADGTLCAPGKTCAGGVCQ